MCLFGHPRETWVFSKLQGFQYYFPENFRSNSTYYERDDFSDSSITFSIPKILGFLLWKKNSLTWAVKCEI